MTGFNSKRAMANWDSPQVRIVYEILIDGEKPPNPDEHWEGFVARKIVAALAQPAQRTFDTHVAPGKALDTHNRLPQSPQREWVGLTETDFSAINQSCLTKLQAATSAESILKERNS